ncbi:hypothetical protein M3Y97_00326000 [Aphelenchoides bicaudatus]|nr:hypothetical protein M3Y97_00326000 [Aphelenchoides bicaudatus]
MPLRSTRNVRRFGLAHSVKWILLIFFVYACILFVWKADKTATLDDSSDRQIIVPRPRRIEVNEKLDYDNKLRAQLLNSASTNSTDSIAVLVFCATREMAIRNHLEQLLKQRPDPDLFPVYVSQDSNTESVQRAVKEFVEKERNVNYMQHERKTPNNPTQRAAKNYFHIAQHYKWALTEIFKKHSTVIITEDDLDIGPDFFNYFAATRPLLDRDPTIFCVSAWNDNGGNMLVDRKRSDLLYRTDFFPGLGWMLKADVGREFLESWPDAYWDDWLRKPEIRKNRVCIRPEITRTAHNNRLAGKGSSNGMYKSYLASIQLPDTPVDFSLVDTHRLEKSTYDAAFRQQLLDAKPLKVDQLLEDGDLSSEFAYRVTYKDPREFRKIADKFKLMNDFRGGMTRTAYYGVVSFMAKGARAHLVPYNLDLTRPIGNLTSETIYDIRWDLMNRFLDFQATYCKPSKWAGKCDPKSPEMIAWFDKKRMRKRLDAWGEMIVI